MTSCRRAGTPSVTLAWTKRRCRPRSDIDIPVLAPDTAGAATTAARREARSKRRVWLIAAIEESSSALQREINAELSDALAARYRYIWLRIGYEGRELVFASVLTSR